MNFGLYFLVMVIAIIGMVYGIKVKKKIITIVSVAVAIVFGLLVTATLILINGIQ